MGTLIAALQPRTYPAANEALLKEPISKVRKTHEGFKMVCDQFSISLKEFEQIFAMNEAVFTMWDSDSNGMVDCLELFTVLILFSDGRVEDKVRFLVDLFDFNGNGYLEEVDL